ncbi:MAG: HAD family hydrolase [Thermoactinomyces sp.]
MKKIVKAIFLDRDGVINEVKTRRVNLVNRPEDFHLLAGVPEAIAGLRRLGFKIFVVTNQGGVGLGYMTERMLLKIHQKMRHDLISKHPEAIIDDILYCPHKPGQGCFCRKPQPGMILKLARKYDVNLLQSWMAGDRQTDLEAGNRAGCRSILISRDYTLFDFANDLSAERIRGQKRFYLE